MRDIEEVQDELIAVMRDNAALVAENKRLVDELNNMVADGRNYVEALEALVLEIQSKD